MPGWLQALAELLGFGPAPGTPEHVHTLREALFRSVKAKNDERAKPPGVRDEARLVELAKRVQRLRIQTAQAKQQLYRGNAEWLLQHLDLGCCPDCPRVHQREAATLLACADWNEQWEVICTLRLQALEQGHPYPPLTMPCLELQQYLPEGLPKEFPPSINRCAACQQRLDQYLAMEQQLDVLQETEEP